MLKGIADLGGVLAMTDAGDVSISRCTFENCKACSWDGGVMVFRGTKNSIFASADNKYVGNSSPAEDAGVAKVEKVTGTHIRFVYHAPQLHEC